MTTDLEFEMSKHDNAEGKLAAAVNVYADQSATIAAQAAEIAELRKALGHFLQLGHDDGNEACDKAKKTLLRLCPEFSGYLAKARDLTGSK